ncbi:MAG TPA: endonuclease/exonuclease/phosphatase family protein, partial [Polyangiaceae bacterium]|nr:endonuclease/exonuclease/phosphatase family protein [Polyangiaceae bacterium]
MKVATWNVNSIRARLDHACDWLERVQPDVLCMQETKVTDDDFPTDEFMRLGYGIAMAGQLSYNGVAI